MCSWISSSLFILHSGGLTSFLNCLCSLFDPFFRTLRRRNSFAYIQAMKAVKAVKAANAAKAAKAANAAKAAKAENAANAVNAANVAIELQSFLSFSLNLS